MIIGTPKPTKYTSVPKKLMKKPAKNENIKNVAKKTPTHAAAM